MGVYAKELLFAIVVLNIVMICICNDYKLHDYNDPALKEIESELMQAYNKRPQPTFQCSFKEHKASLKLYTVPATEKEQETLLLDIQTAVLEERLDYFVGIAETVSAIFSSKISYIFFTENLMVNSVTYRNPLTGRKITLHHAYTQDRLPITVARNYTDPATGSFMDFDSCYPFTKWMSRSFKGYMPKPIRLTSRIAAKSIRGKCLITSCGVGGRFVELVPYLDYSWWEKLYKHNSSRQFMLSNLFRKQ